MDSLDGSSCLQLATAACPILRKNTKFTLGKALVPSLLFSILALDELVLGQRMPAVYWGQWQGEALRLERSRVPGPPREGLHASCTWSAQPGAAFHNWFGRYCPTGGGVIL
jgi:hypothetical protein